MKFILKGVRRANGFVFQQFQVKRRVAPLPRPAVNVHAVNVIPQNFLLRIEREMQTVVAFHAIALFQPADFRCNSRCENG